MEIREVINNSFSLLEHQFARRERELLMQALRERGDKELPKEWAEQKEKRILKAQSDFFYFAKTYFPDYYFNHPFNAKHKWMIEQAQRTDKKCVFIAGPRTFGKTLIFRIFKIWCACFGKRHFYGKVSDTIDLVYKDFKYVRMEMEYNAKIRADFGELIDPGWNAMAAFYVLPHKYNALGTLFSSYSAKVTARGELGKTRPDFFEFDDFEDFSTSINIEISKFKLEVIERDFLPALADDGAAVMLGNNARTTCIFNIIAEMFDTDRAALHPSIELNIIPAWDDKKQKPTWSERYKYKTEEEMRLGVGVSKSVWNSEYQQKPTPPEGTRFLMKDWTTFKTLPKDARGIVFCDPAMGETSCYKAAAVLFYSKTTRRFYSPDAFCRKCGWEDYFLGLYSLYERYKDHIVFFGWESNFFQAQFLDFQRLFVSTADRPRLPIREIRVEGKKEWRIETVETPYSMKDIIFAEDFLKNRDGIEAQAQLIGYGNYPHKDFPDALASAYKEVWFMANSMNSSESSYIGGQKRKFSERF